MKDRVNSVVTRNCSLYVTRLTCSSMMNGSCIWDFLQGSCILMSFVESHTFCPQMMVSSVPDPLTLMEPMVDCWDLGVFPIPGEQRWLIAVCALEWC